MIKTENILKTLQALCQSGVALFLPSREVAQVLLQTLEALQSEVIHIIKQKQCQLNQPLKKYSFKNSVSWSFSVFLK